MGNKIIVLTMYGKNESIENISINLFDRDESYYSESKDNAERYCENINDLELKDNRWVFARIIKQNENITLDVLPKFDIINKLHGLSLQKVLTEVSREDLSRALKNIDEVTLEKIFKNMSKRSAAMLKEDIEALHEISKNDIKSSRNKIIKKIQQLISSGEIVVAKVI